MASLQTEGIVLQKIDYSETSLIVRLLTPEGIQSFIFQGAKRKNKKGNLIRPMAIISVEYFKRGDSELAKIRIVEPALVFKNIPYDPYKSSVLFFMNEVLIKTITEKETDNDLYTFIRSLLEILDLSTNISNFPIKFLYQLTKYLGFYPQEEESGKYLDLQEGKYVRYIPNHPFYLSEEKSAQLIELSGTKFDGVSDPLIPLNRRRELVYDLLKYYEVVIDNFKEVQSVAVLEATFHD
ncbi:MAG: DNA repair protein RecO [Crocinitomicaceae bacterium]|nr:DNA repair protein RecO [Crocinitomicaceae bacterium]